MKFIRPFSAYSARFLICLLLLVSAACFLDGKWLWGDRCIHFTAYWAALSLWMVCWSAWRKNWAFLLVGLGLCCQHGFPLARLWAAKPEPVVITGTPAEITIISANLLGKNPRKEDAVARLAAFDADVLLLMEMNDSWREPMKPLLQKYPHQVGQQYDTWLLSRLPMEGAVKQKLSSELIQSLVKNADIPGTWDATSMLKTTLMVGGKPLRLTAIHPPIPSNSNRLAVQHLQIAAYQAALDAPPELDARILLGDFNTTPFSATFREIRSVTGLRDASAGLGYHPTWGPVAPFFSEPFLPWLGIPIDHALVSSGVEVLENEVGEMPGSDHRWRRLRLRF